MARPRNPAPAIGAELEALESEWVARGPKAIRLIRDTDPAAYMRLIALAIRIEVRAPS